MSKNQDVLPLHFLGFICHYFLVFFHIHKVGFLLICKIKAKIIKAEAGPFTKTKRTPINLQIIGVVTTFEDT